MKQSLRLLSKMAIVWWALFVYLPVGLILSTFSSQPVWFVLILLVGLVLMDWLFQCVLLQRGQMKIFALLPVST
ncbi:MAG: hypothetical protein KC944_24830, partial [Candidatus Omnitrophica bacterium]|nr:hypothetical protein [Candidatus Omnitrophota bacterium]